MQIQIPTCSMAALIKQGHCFSPEHLLAKPPAERSSNNKSNVSIPKVSSSVSDQLPRDSSCLISHICPGSARLLLHRNDRNHEEIFITLHVLGWRNVRGPEEGRSSCFVSCVLLTQAVFFFFFLVNDELRNQIAKQLIPKISLRFSIWFKT